MIKKILGSILVVSSLLLTSCGYTLAEQKFYNACIKLDVEKIKTIAARPEYGITVLGDSSKTICDNIIKEANKRAKAIGLKQKDIDALFNKLAKMLNAKAIT